MMKKETVKNIITVFLLLLFTAFVIIGSQTDEVRLVFTKAINICLECIGIG